MATMNNQMLITLAKAANGITEEAHTYAHWKGLGYQVRKGEHAAFSTMIWKYAPGKEPANEEGEEAAGRMFMKKASFFTASQVDPITRNK